MSVDQTNLRLLCHWNQRLRSVALWNWIWDGRRLCTSFWKAPETTKLKRYDLFASESKQNIKASAREQELFAPQSIEIIRKGNMRFCSWFVNQCFSSFLKSSQHPSQNRRRVFIIATVDEQPPRLFVALLDDLNDFHEASVISRKCSRNKETKQCSEGTTWNFRNFRNLLQ